nr:hypothetical protein [Halorhodospira halochloris]
MDNDHGTFGGEATIDQTGEGHTASIVQQGGQFATIIQEGSQNTASIGAPQQGFDGANEAGDAYWGNNNNASIAQDGTENSADIRQQGGTGISTADIDQVGNGNTAAISQMRGENDASITQHANNAEANIDQRGVSASFAELHQIGDNSIVSITQTDSTDASAVQGFWNNHSAVLAVHDADAEVHLLQDGVGSSADLTVSDGVAGTISSNKGEDTFHTTTFETGYGFINVHQDGSAHEVNIDQNGGAFGNISVNQAGQRPHS